MTLPADRTAFDIDESRFGAVLAMVGPASEARLLRSLIGDLEAARAGLARARSARDATGLRDQTHVLLSLAGTFGAVSLAVAARDLAGQNLAEGAVPDLRPVLARIEDLVAFLSARLAGRRPGRPA